MILQAKSNVHPHQLVGALLWICDWLFLRQKSNYLLFIASKLSFTRRSRTVADAAIAAADRLPHHIGAADGIRRAARWSGNCWRSGSKAQGLNEWVVVSRTYGPLTRQLISFLVGSLPSAHLSRSTRSSAIQSLTSPQCSNGTSFYLRQGGYVFTRVCPFVW